MKEVVLTSAETISKNLTTLTLFEETLYSNVLQVEFNNAIKENSSQTLRHASKKVNMEKNQNPRIIPCESISEIYSSDLRVRR